MAEETQIRKWNADHPVHDRTELIRLLDESRADCVEACRLAQEAANECGDLRQKLVQAERVIEEYRLRDAVNVLIRPHGCEFTGIGPDAVAVMGDARAYLPSVIISVPMEMTQDRIAEISTEITNKVRGISRVLMDVPVQPSEKENSNA